MIPLSDENPTELAPIVTVSLIVLNVLAWLVLQGAGSGEKFLESLCTLGAIPGSITGVIPAGTVVPLGEAACRTGAFAGTTMISSMFLHGGWLHLIGNMWFLWVFGNNIEDSMGHFRFVVFYLGTGLLATGAHVLFAWNSPVPVVGASGAISGVMGAYMVLYPRVRVNTLVIFFYFIQVVALPAIAWLGVWFLLQLLEAVWGAGGAVAFWAHIGGFVAGAVLIKLFARPRLVEAKRLKRKLTRAELGRWERW